MKEQAKNIILNTLIVIITILFAYTLCEIAYRSIEYRKLSRADFMLYVIGVPFYEFNKDLGYKYISNTKGNLQRIDGANNVLISNKVSINNYGHSSSRDDYIYKKDSEYRIAVIGDSFTASVTNDTPWPDLLQDIFNKDQELKKKLNVEAFKVINCGMDGVGVKQFGAIYEHDVKRFDPDTIIINFLTANIFRTFLWRNTFKMKQEDPHYLSITTYSLPASLKNKDYVFNGVVSIDPLAMKNKEIFKYIRNQIIRMEIDRIPWLKPYPELLSRILNVGPMKFIFPIRGKLFMKNKVQYYYKNKRKAYETAINTFKHISSDHGNVIIIHNPDYYEILKKRIPYDVSVLIKEAPDLNITSMIDKFKINDILIKSFNYPYDAHFSNDGAKAYAYVVYEKLRKYLLTMKD